MRVLWLCNVILPQIADYLNTKKNNYGGWLVGLSNALIREKGIELTIIFPETKGLDRVKGETDNMKFYSFPVNNGIKKYNSELEIVFEQIVKESNPDIVQIFGTEYPHTLSMMNALKKLNLINISLIHIQGLVSVYAEHYYMKLPTQIINACTIRELIKRDNIKNSKNDLYKRGRFEIRALELAKNVLGRTTWDYACTNSINKELNYYFCNENLRDSFYKKQWNYDLCEKYSIFASQGSSPIKGLHVLIESIGMVVKYYPSVKLYIAGSNPFHNDSFFGKLKQNSYSKYIQKLIKKYSLKNNINFVGLLDEKEMCDRFLKSNIFTLTSQIENSPNSLGEAMLLGVPSIASNVGGVSDLFTHEVDGFLYQPDAPYMLAFYIMKIFGNSELAEKISKNARVHAQKTHDRIKNINNLLRIYSEINKTS